MTKQEQIIKIKNEIEELEISKRELATEQKKAPNYVAGIGLLCLCAVPLGAIAFMVFIGFWAPFVLGRWLLYLSPVYIFAAYLNRKTPSKKVVEENKIKKAMIEKEIESLKKELEIIK